MTTLREKDPHGWGLQTAVLPCAAFALSIAVILVLRHAGRMHAGITDLGPAVLLAVALYAATSATAWAVGRPVAARYGGWGPSFGVNRPHRIDLRYAAGGVLVAYALRIVVVLIARPVFGAASVRDANNLPTHSLSAAAIVYVVIVAVLIAPVLEEIIFRGLILRTIMWRWGFWPATVVSSALWGGFHAYEGHSIAGGIVLACAVGSTGIVNSVLQRRTARLAPGLMVHATVNVIAVVVLIVKYR